MKAHILRLYKFEFELNISDYSALVTSCHTLLTFFCSSKNKDESLYLKMGILLLRIIFVQLVIIAYLGGVYASTFCVLMCVDAC